MMEKQQKRCDAVGLRFSVGLVFAVGLRFAVGLKIEDEEPVHFSPLHPWAWVGEMGLVYRMESSGREKERIKENLYWNRWRQQI